MQRHVPKILSPVRKTKHVPKGFQGGDFTYFITWSIVFWAMSHKPKISLASLPPVRHLGASKSKRAFLNIHLGLITTS